jgi:hypothetical protein
MPTLEVRLVFNSGESILGEMLPKNRAQLDTKKDLPNRSIISNADGKNRKTERIKIY